MSGTRSARVLEKKGLCCTVRIHLKLLTKILCWSLDLTPQRHMHVQKFAQVR